ncbi:acyl-CoA dehydrogenase family protein [Leucobacter sp. W1478]|uniref:acyl-CoA dehydrogenase family protein n=1 Tax=Leucobacter sp. W1478 TaxID=3439065 RepID=UPI003F3B0AAE
MSLIWSGAVTFGPVDVPVSPAGESGDHLAPVGGEHAENSGSSRLALEAAFGSLGDASDFGTTGSDTVAAALQFARDLGARRAMPGDGSTREQWETLATLSAHDLAVARAVEPHLDAIAILTQAGVPLPEGTWGVFAAEGGPDPLRAQHTNQGWVLNGTKPWCSLADRLDYALLTARTQAGESRLFSVDLSDPGVHVENGTWHARGLTEIPSGPVTFVRVAAEPVGGPEWYLTRPGFSWGGIGVAACWFGGAVGVARTVFAAARRAPSPHVLAHLGAMDTLLHASRIALADAAHQVDARASGGRLLAKRVRGIVALTCEEVLARAGRALGPGPLAIDATHAKRVADLQLYLRQHHAERDEESLGALLARKEGAPW